MADQNSPLSNNPERSLYSKLVLPAFGLALAAAPQALMAQGSCGGARAGTPACDTTHVKAPFAPTGWKTVAMDHFTMHAADPKKEAAYYQQLMNWKVRSADDKQIVMDMGDVGTVVILGGYVAPPPTAGRGGGGGGGRGGAGGDSAGRGGRGGAGGAAGAAGAARGGAGGGGAVRDPGPNPCTPSPRPVGGTQVAWDSYAWQITPWNAKNVEAELKKRGLNPVADNNGPAGYESFHVKDPDGFDVQISNGGYAKQRKASPAKGKLEGVTMPFEPTNWKTVWLDHLSFGVSDYKESYTFYQTLLGWKPTGDEGSQNETEICDDCGNTIIRGPNSLNPAFDKTAPRRASIGHIAFGLEPFEPDATKADLDKRSLGCRADTGGSLNIHDEAAKYKSYHTTTPQGFDLQISNATKARRTVR